MRINDLLIRNDILRWINFVDLLLLWVYTKNRPFTVSYIWGFQVDFAVMWKKIRPKRANIFVDPRVLTAWIVENLLQAQESMWDFHWVSKHFHSRLMVYRVAEYTEKRPCTKMVRFCPCSETRHTRANIRKQPESCRLRIVM